MACLDGLEGIPLPVGYLVRCIKLPKPYLSKIIQILATKDFLETKRVNKGEILFARPPEWERASLWK